MELPFQFFGFTSHLILDFRNQQKNWQKMRINSETFMKFEQIVTRASHIHDNTFEALISRSKFSINGIIHEWKGTVILNSECGVNFITQSTV